jgi:hypothetical protein
LCSIRLPQNTNFRFCFFLSFYKIYGDPAEINIFPILTNDLLELSELNFVGRQNKNVLELCTRNVSCVTTNANIFTKLIFLHEPLKVKGDGSGGNRAEVTSSVGIHGLILGCVR